MTQLTKRAGLLLVLGLLAGACAAGKAFRQGEAAMKSGDVDAAVAYYRTAVQNSPDNPNYKIALQRAMQAASRYHLDRAKEFEQKDQLEAALGEYRQASEYDPANRLAVAKAAEIERTIRDRIEASRPKPAFQQMRERARAELAGPTLLNFTTPLGPIRFQNASLRDILNFIANSTGINIIYDREFTDRPATVQLEGVTLEQALNQILATNQLSYKVVNDRTILIFPDTPAKHAQYDEQVIRTFYISHADATELSQVLNSVIRLPGMPVQPQIVANKTANTITVRGTTAVTQIVEKIIEQNDKPRAEIMVDVEILEVNRERLKNYGINLSEYAIGGIFSPEVSPSSTTTTTPGTTTGTPSTTPGTPTTTPGTPTTTTTNTGRSLTPSGALGASPPAFNLNTLSQGVATTDFYLAVPTAIVRFLETDTESKLIAKPQLRGAEGTKLTLKLGDSIPIISTSYTPIAGGGAAVNPLSSYTYKDVGINLEMTPRVTLDGDIILDLMVDDSSLGTNISVAGVSVPSFGQRTVTTRLRLRDGESNLLAGLIREDTSKQTQGFPGAVRVPFLKQLLSGNQDDNRNQDIVMLLTPHIIRTHELTDTDLKPIYIGSQGNLSLGGPPPLIVPPGGGEQPNAGGQQPGVTPNNPALPTPPNTVATGVPPATVATPSGAQPQVAVPPGSSPVPGTVPVPPAPAQPTPNITVPANPPGTETGAAGATGATPAAGGGATGATPAAGAGATGAAGAAGATPAGQEPPITSPGLGSAQVMLTPPGTTFRVGGGPYTVPISISNAARLSTVTLTLLYNPNVLRVRAVQEGSFMRTGGAQVSFSQQATTPGRVDITISRAADATGASGTGLLAAVLFDAIAPGSATLTLSGAATGPGDTAMGLQFRPVTVVVQQ